MLSRISDDALRRIAIRAALMSAALPRGRSGEERMERGRRPYSEAGDPAVAFAHQQFVNLFLSQNRRAQAGLWMAAALIAALWYSHAGAPAALLWLATVTLVSGSRIRFTDGFVRQHPERSLRRIAGLLAVNGVLIAVPLVSFNHLAETERAAYSIILLASATASVATTAGYRAIFLAYAAPMLVSLGAAWIFLAPRGDAAIAGRGLGVLIFIFLFFLVSVARQAWRVFDESCRIRWAEQGLNAELKRALDDADEANRVKTQFLAAASHDLRQPIHSINVLIAALSRRPLDARSDEIVSLLGTVNQTLASQLDGLLDVSRLDAGTVRPQLAPHRLDQLLATHHGALTEVAAEHGLECKLMLESELSALTDAALLLRVLSNLTDNAMKFTPRGGSVTLGLRRDGDLAALWVSDSGIGIPDAEQELVFREFYQVGNVERDRSKGLGLGLSIVQRLCRLLGAELTLVSRPSVGTTVTIRLPLAMAGAPVIAEPVAVAVAVDLPEGLSVLVIDDQPQVRDAMRLLLSGLGCQVLLADGIAEATQLADTQTIDAALSDLRLGGGDSGVDALAHVHARHPTARLALLTGDTDPARIQAAEATGIPVLHKPVPVRQLLAILLPARGATNPPAAKP